MRTIPIAICAMSTSLLSAQPEVNQIPQLFHRITDVLERCLPTRERISIPGASHTVPKDRPEAYRDAVLTFLAKHSTQQRAPISADEVTLRHKIYGNERVTVFLLDIPPGQATMAPRHGRDMLSVFVSGGRTRASFNGAPTVEDTFAAGDVRFRFAGFTHSTENVGTERFTISSSNSRAFIIVSFR
ncbi:MAG: hypothetical protein H0X67_17325 [Acidobacteria bacterium]|nr:hypothetical protein [Acidobacteriota bacterium]